MANKSGNAYGLTVFSPIINGSKDNESFSAVTRKRLQQLHVNERSPMSVVPNTYLSRFYVLNDVFYEGSPAVDEHLKSKYLIFSSNFYGELEPYIEGMWKHSEDFIRSIWEHCVAFNKVNSAQSFVEYIKKCQINNSLFFNGSNDEPLNEQLKGLYLKQEFSKFAYANQGKPASELQQAFNDFISRTQPNNLSAPTWVPGLSDIK